MRSIVWGAVVWCFWVASSASLAAEEVVPVGAGSYLTSRPKLCKPLPESIFRTRELTGPMLTGQWWSSLVFQKFSQPLFAHPLAMQCKEEGLAVWYPGSKIHGNEHGIFGVGSGKNGDLLIGLEGAKFPQADCGGFSDWFVTSVFADGKKTLRTTFGHGSPFVFCTSEGANPQISFGGAAKLWSANRPGTTRGVTVNGHHYGLYALTPWKSHDGNKTWSIESPGKSAFSIAILPSDNEDMLQLAEQYAHNHVLDSRVEYEFAGGMVKSKIK